MAEKQVSISISIEDIFKYLLCTLAMGLNQQPEIHCYWNRESTNSGLFGNSFIQSLMSRNLWVQVHRWIYYPVDKILSHLNKSFKRFYNPSDFVAIDEILLLFKGRFSGRQHIRGKPHSTGLKFFALADKNGYLFSFWLYKGANKNSHSPNVQSRSSTTSSERNSTSEDGTIEVEADEVIIRSIDAAVRSASPVEVVMDFARELHSLFPNRKFIFYADSYFGSYKLAQQLQSLGMYFNLCCQPNHPSELFSQFLHKQLRKGDFNYILNEKEKILALSFYDSKICNFISNYASVLPLNSVDRPNTSNDYNQHMNSVDVFDSGLNRYMYRHKKRKWTKCLLLNLFKMAVVNAWTIFKLRSPRTTQKNFIQMLLKPYSKNLGSPSSFLVPRQRIVHSKKEKRHNILKAEKHDRCLFCKLGGQKATSTVYKCSICNVFLHPACFQLYHERTDK